MAAWGPRTSQRVQHMLLPESALCLLALSAAGCSFIHVADEVLPNPDANVGQRSDAAHVMDSSALDAGPSLPDARIQDSAAENDAVAELDAAADADVGAGLDAAASADATVDAGDCAPETKCAWLQASAGGLHTCGLRGDGSLWCWGFGDYGQRGDGWFNPEGSVIGWGVARPVRVLMAGEEPGGAAWTDWTAVAAGSAHTCGLRSDGTLWCWGIGYEGQRGDGTTDRERATPVQVLAADEPPGGTGWGDWTAVSCAAYATCGMRANGSLWCWGNGRATPRRILAPDESSEPGSPGGWVAVSTGPEHTCALRANGTLWCWGHNSRGKLGDGTTETRSEPTQVIVAEGDPGDLGWNDWLAVSTRRSHTCGSRSDGTLWCWGEGDHGRRGDGTTRRTRTTPAQVLAAGAVPGGDTWSDWVSVSAGDSHTCGLRRDGTQWCWGSGFDGRRGDGRDPLLTGYLDVVQSTPVQVLAADEPAGGTCWDDWSMVTAGGDHTCGLREDGSLWCWGNGRFGQRGDGSTIHRRMTPREVIDPE
jgi:alpha-tubulin suppressor-like RCC1 family protein